MANELWQERVRQAQEAAASRLGVDVSVMLPPRNPSEGGSAHAAEEAAEEPVASAVTEDVVTEDVVAEAEAVVETASAAPAAAATTPGGGAAERIAAAKERAAAKAAANGAPAPAAPATRPAAPRPAPARATAVEEAQEEVGQPGMNRREFITYAWAAALGLLTLEGGLATYLFMYPRFRAGEFGGKFELGPAAALPATDVGPLPDTTGKFWLVNTEEGPKAIYMVCTHLGCLYKWEPSNFRFECPCHGSKFTREGHYIEGPAPRSLDNFVVEVVEGGEVVAKTEDSGDAIVPPMPPSPDAVVMVDTGKRLQGKSAATSPANAST